MRKSTRWLPNLFSRLSIVFMFFSGAVGELGDIGKFTVMFKSLGIPAAPVVAPAVAIVELAGGVALMLGLATRLVSLVLAMDMVGALLTDIGPILAEKYSSVSSFVSNLFYSSEWLLSASGAIYRSVYSGPGSAASCLRLSSDAGARERVGRVKRVGEADRDRYKRHHDRDSDQRCG
jgi:putative oxidoreductase